MYDASMPYEFIQWDVPAPHVARITMNRPALANAINHAMLEEIADALERIEGDDDIHAWILTGSPRLDGRDWFSAGVDMKEALAGESVPRIKGSDLCMRIDDSLKPSICAIGGTCTTGALELALACDIRVAGQSAQLSDFHMVRAGLAIGAWGGAARLSRLVGPDKAKELLLLSSVTSGEEAARIGLVNRAVPDDQVAEQALEIASTIAAMPRRGVRATLAFLQMSADLPKHEAIHLGDITPSVMGMKLRPFKDAASRFFSSNG
jgi:enoyl-CoA hydratase/carnithine racemase